MAECKCDLRTALVGDGCSVCNPAKSLEYALERETDYLDLLNRLHDMIARFNVEATAKMHEHWNAEARADLALIQELRDTLACRPSLSSSEG